MQTKYRNKKERIFAILTQGAKTNVTWVTKKYKIYIKKQCKSINIKVN